MGGSELSHADPERLELVVVALPTADDQVWNYSSEKVPHLTLLYLGKPDLTPSELMQMTLFIQHASSQFERFGLSVDKRGTLGDQEADVLFFDKRYTKRVAEFRSNLLANESINKAYHGTTQYPEWTPHLTMGYPDKPAKKDTRDYSGFSWVNFDRISLWVADYEGPIFELKNHNYDDSEMAMGEDAIENILAHYGVKGMQWGVRKKRTNVPAGQVLVDRNKKGALVTKGGVGYKPHDDAVKKVVAQQIVKKSGTQALSNKELQDLATRLSLETQVNRLQPQTGGQKVKKFVAETLLGVGKQQATRVANDVAAKQVGTMLADKKK